MSALPPKADIRPRKPHDIFDRLQHADEICGAVNCRHYPTPISRVVTRAMTATANGIHSMSIISSRVRDRTSFAPVSTQPRWNKGPPPPSSGGNFNCVQSQERRNCYSDRQPIEGEPDCRDCGVCAVIGDASGHDWFSPWCFMVFRVDVLGQISCDGTLMKSSACSSEASFKCR